MNYCTWLWKRIFLFRLTFSNLKKLIKFVIRIRIKAALRFLVTIENIGQYEILSWDNFLKQKTLWKIFRSKLNILELQCLVHDLVEFLEISMFVNTSLTWMYYLKRWIRDMEKNILLGTICIVFFFKMLQILIITTNTYINDL